MKKIASFFICILPFLLFWGTMLLMLVMAYLGSANKDSMDAMKWFLLVPVMLLTVVTIIVMCGVMIWLIIKAINNQWLMGVEKVIWCICLFLFNIYAFPIYWFVYLRKE